MERLTISVGTFEVNCSILSENGKAWIVDPGQESDRIAGLLAQKGLEPAAILLTHAHFDHIGGVTGLQKNFPGLPVYVHANDRPVITHPLNLLPPEYPSVTMPDNLRGIDELHDLNIEVIETPGHTPGSVCYFLREQSLLLSGDTLFAGSIGRTDFPGGDMSTMICSLRKLSLLPDDTLVIPGHGSHTTIRHEKQTNPFLTVCR